MRNLRTEPEIGARTAALTFVEGVSHGWTYPAFEEWYLRHLVLPGRMRPPGKGSLLVIQEPGVGVVEMSENLWRLPLKERLVTNSRLFLAQVSAHTRVLTALRRMVVSQSMDFVHGAYRSRRLVRSEWEPAWFVSLQPTDALSDCVLALFAADYMHRSDDYLGLSVCRICDRVRFRREGDVRTLCERHADLSPRRAHVSGVYRKSASDPGSCPESVEYKAGTGR